MIAYKNNLFNDLQPHFTKIAIIFVKLKLCFYYYYLHFYAQLSQEISNRMQCVSCFLFQIGKYIFGYRKSYFLWLNKVHSSLHGIHFHKGSNDYCWHAEHFLIWKNLDYGIFVWHREKDIVVSDCVLADNGVGLALNVYGPASVNHQMKDNVIVVRNSILIGQSDNFNCSLDQVIPYHANIYNGRRLRKGQGRLWFHVLLNTHNIIGNTFIRVVPTLWTLYRRWNNVVYVQG